jgi:hypothetical protein
VDKLADNYQLTPSDILRSLLPDVKFLLLLADNPDDIDEPETLIPELLQAGIRWYMQKHPRYPLCDDDLRVVNKADKQQLYHLFADFCKAVSGLNADEGYGFEEIKKGKQIKYKIKHPAHPKPEKPASVPIDTVAECVRQMLAIPMPPVSNKALLKKYRSRIPKLADYDKSMRQTLAACGMDEKQVEEFMKSWKKRCEDKNKL